MPDLVVVDSGRQRDLSTLSDPDMVVAFTVRVQECADAPHEALVHDIKGEIFLVDEHGQEEERIGRLEAELVNVDAIAEEGELFDAYDSRSDELVEACSHLFDIPSHEWNLSTLEVAGFEDCEPAWHVHVSHVFIDPDARGRKFGLKALHLLKRYLARPGLIATILASPDQDRTPAPSGTKLLSAYFRSDAELGFAPLAKDKAGWLIADWSSL